MSAFIANSLGKLTKGLLGRRIDGYDLEGFKLDVLGAPLTVAAKMESVSHRIRWRPGTRKADSAEITLQPYRDDAFVITLEPMLTFQMLGLGYLHPEWGHGLWKGEEVVGFEEWKLADVNPLDPRYIHIQELCRARMGEREGIGILEQLVIGPHPP